MAKTQVTAEQENSTTGRRRPGRPSLSNEELLDTALDLFLERGFERTSIDAITAAAGMAKRTVYARYGDKTTLFKAALTRAIDEWIVPVERLQAAEADDLETTLFNIGELLVTNVLSPAGLRLLRLTNEVSAHMPEIGIYNVQHGTEPTLEYLADLFRCRLGDANKDADLAAQAFLSIVVGGLANNVAWGLVIGPDDIGRHVRYSVHLFLHGLLADREVRESDGNEQLRGLLDEAAQQLDKVRSRIDEAGKLARK